MPIDASGVPRPSRFRGGGAQQAYEPRSPEIQARFESNTAMANRKLAAAQLERNRVLLGYPPDGVPPSGTVTEGSAQSGGSGQASQEHVDPPAADTDAAAPVAADLTGNTDITGETTAAEACAPTSESAPISAAAGAWVAANAARSSDSTRPVEDDHHVDDRSTRQDVDAEGDAPVLSAVDTVVGPVHSVDPAEPMQDMREAVSPELADADISALSSADRSASTASPSRSMRDRSDQEGVRSLQRTKRPASAAQVAASRKNGRRGGPKSVAGKEVSKYNAWSHGGYAQDRPVRVGPHREDAAQIALRCEEIIAAMAPRNAAAHDMAELVASRLLTEKRLNRAEDLRVRAFEDEVTVAVGHERFVLRAALNAQVTITSAREWLVKAFDLIEATGSMKFYENGIAGLLELGQAEALSRYLADTLHTERPQLSLEDEDGSPTDERSWQRVLRSWIANEFNGRLDEFADWLEGEDEQVQGRVEAATDAMDAAEAERGSRDPVAALPDLMPIIQARAANNKALALALAMFEQCQKINSDGPDDDGA